MHARALLYVSICSLPPPSLCQDVRGRTGRGNGGGDGGKTHCLGWPPQSGQPTGIMEATQPQTSGYPDDDILAVSRFVAEGNYTLNSLEYGVEVIRRQMVLVS